MKIRKSIEKNNIKKEFRLLFTSSGSGRRVRLLQFFQKELKKLSPSGRLYVMDSNPLSPGLALFPDSFLAPSSSSPEFAGWLMDLCRREHIDGIIPTTDVDLLVLSEVISLFRENGIKIVMSPPETVRLCHSKRSLMNFLKCRGIKTPEIFHDFPGKEDFPVFLKPDHGTASRNSYRVDSPELLKALCAQIDMPLITEWIDGVEYTVDAFFDEDGKPVSIVPRERIATRAGVSDTGKTVHVPELIETVRIISTTLKFTGPVNFQFIRNKKGIFYAIEINPRFSGGISLTIMAGANFPEWTIKLIQGKKLTERIGMFKKNLIMMVYEQAVYKFLK